MAKEGNFRVKNFNGQNYQLWKMQMEDYLYQKDLYLPLGRKAKKLAAMKDEGTGNNTAVPSFVSGLQYFERKNNKGCDKRIE